MKMLNSLKISSSLLAFLNYFSHDIEHRWISVINYLHAWQGAQLKCLLCNWLRNRKTYFKISKNIGKNYNRAILIFYQSDVLWEKMQSEISMQPYQLKIAQYFSRSQAQDLIKNSRHWISLVEVNARAAKSAISAWKAWDSLRTTRLEVLNVSFARPVLSWSCAHYFQAG